MRRKLAPSIAGLALILLASMQLSAAIRGDYVEVRSADVYTGPCFANAEVGLTGDQAILAWRVKEGSWQGVKLDGLTLVAVVKASATLGDPYHNPYPAKSVLIVDERATGRQQEALRNFARSMARDLLQNVVRVEKAAIRLDVGEGASAGSVKLEAGNMARIETRSLCAHDHICGNEFVYYPPLVSLSRATPAYTLDEAFNGQGLGVTWDRADRRSAFIGTFTL